MPGQLTRKVPGPDSRPGHPFADNIGSVRVLEKAGYVREGLLRSSSVKFGTPRDQYMFARVNPAWVYRDVQ